MSKVELKVGDIFNFTKVGYLYYKILELDKSSNYAKIELILRSRNTYLILSIMSTKLS